MFFIVFFCLLISYKSIIEYIDDVQKSALQLECLGNYLAELTLVEYGLLRYLPSMIASSAVFLAKLTLDPTARPWASI